VVFTGLERIILLCRKRGRTGKQRRGGGALKDHKKLDITLQIEKRGGRPFHLQEKSKKLRDEVSQCSFSGGGI